MKIEYVGFYPIPKPKYSKNKFELIGTIHIYLVDYELDLRGILVFRKGNLLRFRIHHFNAIDTDSGESVKYPLVRFTNQEKHKILMDFLHKKASIEVQKELKPEKKKTVSKT